MAKEDKTAGRVPAAESGALPAPTGEDAVYLAPRPVEEWLDLRGTPQWQFESARALKNWAIGVVVSADEYDAAVKASQEIKVG